LTGDAQVAAEVGSLDTVHRKQRLSELQASAAAQVGSALP